MFSIVFNLILKLKIYLMKNRHSKSTCHLVGNIIVKDKKETVNLPQSVDP